MFIYHDVFGFDNYFGRQTFSLANRGRRISAKVNSKTMFSHCYENRRARDARYCRHSIQCLGFDISIRSSLHSPSFWQVFPSGPMPGRCLVENRSTMRTCHSLWYFTELPYARGIPPLICRYIFIWMQCFRMIRRITCVLILHIVHCLYSMTDMQLR